MDTILAVGCVALLMMLCELSGSGRRWPLVTGWWARAIALNAVQIGAVYLAGSAWDGWMLENRPFSADELGVYGGAAVGYTAVTFVYYWWHRARHQVDFLWRWFHQIHHSPQRIEIITSFYKHPVEIVANSMLSSAILYFGVGLGAEAAAIAITATGLAELVYHWNVPTPYALGFVFQRPESHCVHHQQGLHTHNYGDLPLWDMMFGTFHNPRKWDSQCGFSDNRERRLTDMLRGIDVHASRDPQ